MPLTRLAAAIALVLAAAALPGPAWAQDYAAFLGHWKGSGISQTDESLYFAETVRDMDVVIEAVDAQAFRLTWTTVTRESGDPENPDIARKTASIVFRATGVPGVYRDEAAEDPRGGVPYWWSRVDGTVLHTHLLTLNPDGTWGVQSYIREITADGMALTYRRIADGHAAREVTGRLIKYGR